MGSGPVTHDWLYDGLLSIAASRVPWPKTFRRAIVENPQAVALFRMIRPGYDNRGYRKAGERAMKQHIDAYERGEYSPQPKKSWNLQARLAQARWAYKCKTT